MKRLVIAVNCDDVLVPSMERIVEIYNNTYGTNVQLEGAHDGKNPDWQSSSHEEIAERIHAIQEQPEYAATAPFEDAREACRRLAQTHELHLVTARPGGIMTLTLAMLERYFKGVFTEIEHVGFKGNKGEICQRLAAHQF